MAALVQVVATLHQTEETVSELVLEWVMATKFLPSESRIFLRRRRKKIYNNCSKNSAESHESIWVIFLGSFF